jgi:hypothetical protein
VRISKAQDFAELVVMVSILKCVFSLRLSVPLASFGQEDSKGTRAEPRNFGNLMMLTVVSNY